MLQFAVSREVQRGRVSRTLAGTPMTWIFGGATSCGHDGYDRSIAGNLFSVPTRACELARGKNRDVAIESTLSTDVHQQEKRTVSIADQ